MNSDQTYNAPLMDEAPSLDGLEVGELEIEQAMCPDADLPGELELRQTDKAERPA